MSRIWLLGLLAHLSLGTVNAYGLDGRGQGEDPSEDQRELRSAVTDRAALDSQNTALGKLAPLLKRARGTSKEVVLLYRMAEIHYQNAGMSFRIGHAETSQTKLKANLTESNHSLQTAVKLLSEILKKFPDFSDTARVLFLRGKAYGELELKELAKTDYLALIKNHPESSDLSSARMALAIYAIEEKHHAQAIAYLEPIEKDPLDTHYPFALYKLAWSHYNLQHFTQAQGYLERQITTYRKGWSGNAKLSTSDQALIETSLQDYALFEADAFEAKDPAYQISKAAPKFARLESGPFYGKMLLRFARLLKAKGFQKELREWAQAMLPLEFHRPEMFDIALLIFEDGVNLRQYDKAAAASEFFVKITDRNPKTVREFDSYKKAQGRLLDVTQILHGLIKKNRHASDLPSLTRPLAQMYDVFTRLVEPTDPRIPGAHFNLAETLYEIRQYERASEHYFWIVSHWTSAWAQGTHALKHSKKDVEIRNISARYQSLLSKGLIPEKLELRRTDVDRPELESSGPAVDNALVAQWLEWVDSYAQSYGTMDAAFHAFYFEGIRTLYRFGKTWTALKRAQKWTLLMGDTVTQGPVEGAARLHIDTLILSEKWQALFKHTQDLLKYPKWRQLIPQLETTSVDAHTRLTVDFFRDKNFTEVLRRASAFEKIFPQHARREDVWWMAAQSAKSLDDSSDTIDYTTKIVDVFPKSDTAALALMLRSQVRESTYEFGKVADDLTAYWNLKQRAKQAATEKSGSMESIKTKILLMRWLSGDAQQLLALTRTAGFCPTASAGRDDGSFRVTCERYEALSFLGSKHRSERKYFWKMATHGDKENRALWAAAALTDQDALPFPDRLALARMIATHWDKLESHLKLALLPMMTLQVPRVFELNRIAIRQYAKLSANEQAIERRVNLIQEMETTATQVTRKLQWARVRVQVLGEISQLYLEFAKALQDTPAPESLPAEEKKKYQETLQGLVLPFEEKGQDIRRKAFDLASKSGVEGSVSDPIAQAFFADNPSQATEIHGGVVPVERDDDVSEAIPISVLASWDESTHWSAALPPAQLNLKHSLYLHNAWARALSQKNWPWVSYFFQEIERKKLIQPATLELMRAIALSQAGAQSEALGTLESVRSQLPLPARVRVTLRLLTDYVRTYSKDRARTLVEELAKWTQDTGILFEAKTETEAFAIAFASIWGGGNIPADQLISALATARYSGSTYEAAWASAHYKELATAPKASRKAASVKGTEKSATQRVKPRKRK